MICVSLGNIDFKRAMEIATESEMVEIRADLLNFSETEYRELISRSKKVVFTCRKDDDKLVDRKSLFAMALELNVDYIDLETESVEELLDWLKLELEGRTTQLILSYHNFELTPNSEDLLRILKQFFKLGADVAKIACMANSDEDVVNLIKMYRKQGRKIVLGMGEKGLLTRVAAPVLGAEFTFASADKESATAPGQLSVKEMKDLFEIMKIQ